VCLGILVADMFASPLAELPSAGGIRLVDEIYPDTGGCAANTGVSLVRLGLRAALVGKVGDDVFGDFIIQDMANRGLDVAGIRRSKSVGTSKTMIITVTGEDRRFIHTLGASADFTYGDIDLDLVARGKVLYVGGYLVLPKLDPDSLAQLLQFAKERGLLTVLDVIVPAGGGHHVSTDLAQVLPHVDVFLPNDDEGRLLTGEEDPVEQARCFLSYGCPNVVITMGGRGAIAANQQSILRAPAFAVPVVDPSGAGDAFDAGYIYGLLKGWPLARTLTFASAIGASACMKLGTTPGVFTAEEARSFLDQNELELESIHTAGAA
jgi:sugar/nucleoside kinase (ribokinase family)